MYNPCRANEAYRREKPVAFIMRLNCMPCNRGRMSLLNRSFSWSTSRPSSFHADRSLARRAEKDLGFLYAMKTIADQLDPTAMQISKRRTLLKLIDEYDYSHFTKAWA